MRQVNPMHCYNNCVGERVDVAPFHEQIGIISTLHALENLGRYLLEDKKNAGKGISSQKLVSAFRVL